MKAPTPRGVLGDIAKLASGSAVAQLFTVLATPVVTRLYDPASYATWAIVVSIVVLLGVFATMRFELAIVLPQEHSEAAPIACLATLLCVGISTLSIPLFFFEGFARLLFASEGTPSLYFWVPLLTALTGINQITNYWCTRSQRFAVIAKSALLLAVATFGGQMSATSFGYSGAEGLLFGSVFGNSVSVLYQVACVARADFVFFIGAWRPHSLREAALRYKNYPLYMAPYTLIGVIRDRIVLFFLGASGNSTETGYYAFANRIVNLPVSLISSAIRPVIFRKASVEGIAEVEDLLVSVMRFIVLLATPVWLLFLFWAPDLFSFAFGNRWKEAGNYAVILAFPAYAQLLANWLDRLLDAAGKQRLAFIMESVFSILAIAVFSGFYYGKGNLRVAVGVQATIIALYNLYWVYIIFRVGNFKWTRLQELARLFAIVAGVCAIVLVTGLQTLPIQWAVLIYLGLGLIYLIFLGRHLRFSSFAF